MKSPRKIVNEDGGAAAIEYAVLVALIAVVVVGALHLLSDEIQAGWDLAASLLSA